MFVVAYYNQGIFTPKNPRKYIGSGNAVWRSSWELSFMNFLDSHPGVIQWSSENLKIPYLNPLTGKASIYIPDFLIIYVDKNGKKHGEVVEIKPLKETCVEQARSKRDLMAVAQNQAKWSAAREFCSKNGLVFRIMDETMLFASNKKPNQKKRGKK